MSIPSSQPIHPDLIFGKYASYYNPNIELPFDRLKELDRKNLPMIIQPSREKNFPNRFVVIFRDEKVGYIKIIDYIQNKGFFSDKILDRYRYEFPTFDDFVKKHKIYFPTPPQVHSEESKQIHPLISNEPQSYDKEKLRVNRRFVQAVTKYHWNYLSENPGEFFCANSAEANFTYTLFFYCRIPTSKPLPVKSERPPYALFGKFQLEQERSRNHGSNIHNHDRISLLLSFECLQIASNFQ